MFLLYFLIIFFILFELKLPPIEDLGDLFTINPDLRRTFTRSIGFGKTGALIIIPFYTCKHFDAIYIFKIFIFRPSLKAKLSEELILIENKFVGQLLDNFNKNKDYRIIWSDCVSSVNYNTVIKFLTVENY